jgi:hypothetical protein
MNHKVNETSKVAVSLNTFWLPIDGNTPRNVKVLAIARRQSGVVHISPLAHDEKFYTHWHPLPRFRAEE